MVLSYSNSFIALGFCLSLLLSLQSANAQESAAGRVVSKKPRVISVKRTPRIHRLGLGILTIPQEARLVKHEAGINTEARIDTLSSGLHLSYDYEEVHRRIVYTAGVGLSALGVKASSVDPVIDYNYSKDIYMNYLATVGVHYITSASVKVGLGLRTMYATYDLPVAKTPGVSYSFNYGSEFKNFASLELNWQLSRRWLFSQTLLSPLNKGTGTAWLLSLKRTL